MAPSQTPHATRPGAPCYRGERAEKQLFCGEYDPPPHLISSPPARLAQTLYSLLFQALIKVVGRGRKEKKDSNGKDGKHDFSLIISPGLPR